MHCYETIYTNTIMEFLHKTDEFKREGYSLTNANTDKKLCLMAKTQLSVKRTFMQHLKKVRLLTRLYVQYERKMTYALLQAS